MILADGSIVSANQNENPDLFWAIRGGGGNFGVITEFTFQAHKLKTVYGGPTLWPIEQVEEIMEWFDGFIRTASDDINGFIATMIIPESPFPEHLHNKKFCGIVWCYVGDMNKAEEAFVPILAKKTNIRSCWGNALSLYSDHVRWLITNWYAMVLACRFL